MFIHEDPEFAALVRVIATEHGSLPALIEKDYWVTHTLWAIEQTGLELWFKGGTSLSKAFGIVERFSEDVDVKLDPGRITGLPAVGSVRSESASATARRRAYFEALLPHLRIPGARVTWDMRQQERWRSAAFVVTYPGHFLADLPAALRPHVLLEAGLGPTPPSVPRPISSFVHDTLAARGESAAYNRNSPEHVNCVHPIVTLLEKLDAIVRRYPRDPFQPDGIVRHYDDAARIIENIAHLPPLPVGLTVRTLGASWLHHRFIQRPIGIDDPAFILDDATRRAALQRAHKDIAPMFWGAQLSLASACRIIQEWLADADPWGGAA